MKKKLSLYERINVVFENWKAEALVNPEVRKLKIAQNGKGDKSRTIIVTVKELNEFVRCYTENKSDPLYKVRSELPKSWFVASDLLISVHVNGNIYWIKGTDNGKGRIRHELLLNTGKAVYPCLGNIRNVVLNENVSEEARRLFEEKGKEGFKYTEQHHTQGKISYKKGQSERNNERKNKDIQTLTKNEHKMVNSLGRLGRIWEDDPEKSMEIMKKLGKMSASNGKLGVVYEKIDRKTGRVIEQGKI